MRGWSSAPAPCPSLATCLPSSGRAPPQPPSSLIATTHVQLPCPPAPPPFSFSLPQALSPGPGLQLQKKHTHTHAQNQLWNVFPLPSGGLWPHRALSSHPTTNPCPHRAGSAPPGSRGWGAEVVTSSPGVACLSPRAAHTHARRAWFSHLEQHRAPRRQAEARCLPPPTLIHSFHRVIHPASVC